MPSQPVELPDDRTPDDFARVTAQGEDKKAAKLARAVFRANTHNDIGKSYIAVLTRAVMAVAASATAVKLAWVVVKTPLSTIQNWITDLLAEGLQPGYGLLIVIVVAIGLIGREVASLIRHRTDGSGNTS